MEIKTIGQLLDYVETEEKARELIYYINKQKEVLDKIKEYIEKNKTKLYQGRNEFTCEIQYSDEVVKAKDILELLEEIE